MIIEFLKFPLPMNMQIEEAGKLKPLEVDLKRLEDMSDAIVQDFAAARKREEEMRSTNGEHLLFLIFYFFGTSFRNTS